MLGAVIALSTAITLIPAATASAIAVLFAVGEPELTIIALTPELINERISADCSASVALRESTFTSFTLPESEASALIAQTIVSRHEFPAQLLLTPILYVPAACAGAAITDTPITSAIDEATAKPALKRFELSFIAFLPIVDRLWTSILDPSASDFKSFCYRHQYLI